MRALRTPLRELHRIQASLDDIDYAGRTDRHILRQIFTRYDLPITEENFTRFLDHYVATLPSELANPGAFILPGVPALLTTAAARPNITQALLTGNVQRGARAKLSFHGLWDFFPFGAFADDSEHRNDLGPHALRRAREHTGVDFPPKRLGHRRHASRHRLRPHHRCSDSRRRHRQPQRRCALRSRPHRRPAQPQRRHRLLALDRRHLKNIYPRLARLIRHLNKTQVIFRRGKFVCDPSATIE